MKRPSEGAVIDRGMINFLDHHRTMHGDVSKKAHTWIEVDGGYYLPPSTYTTIIVMLPLSSKDLHRNIETCHYTYITTFQPTPEEICEENFDKQCSITFKQRAFEESVKKCNKPVIKVCDGQGKEVSISLQSSKLLEKSPSSPFF